MEPNEREDERSRTYKSGNTTYECDSKDINAQPEDLSWKIRREIVNGPWVYIDYANNEPSYSNQASKIPLNASDYFDEIPIDFYASCFFDGYNDYLLGTGSENKFQVERTTPFSFTGWIRPGAPGVANVIFNKQKAAAPKNGINLRKSATNNLAFQLSNDSAANIFVVNQNSDLMTVANMWYFIAIVFRGSNSPVSADLDIYCTPCSPLRDTAIKTANNVISATLNASCLNTTEKLNIGASSAGVPSAGAMNMMNFTFWNMALSQAQVDAEFNYGIPRDSRLSDQYIADNSVIFETLLMGSGDVVYPTIAGSLAYQDWTMTNMVPGNIVASTPGGAL